MNRLLYFAYGELMNESEMRRHFPHAKMLGVSYLDGFALCFAGRDGLARAALKKSPESRVPGRVWSVFGEDEALLCRLHGAPNTARPEVHPVEVGGMRLPALVMVPSPGQSKGRPGFVAYDLMREAYETAGEDLEALRGACRV